MRIRIHFIRIRIQHFGLNTDPDPKRIRIQGLHKERPSYRRSLQLSKENVQHFKTWDFIIFFNFYGLFLPSWIRIQLGSGTLVNTQRKGTGKARKGVAKVEQDMPFRLWATWSCQTSWAGCGGKRGSPEGTSPPAWVKDRGLNIKKTRGNVHNPLTKLR